MIRFCLMSMVAFVLLQTVWPGHTAADPVTEAFDLRMRGKVDEARSLLKERLADAPDDAAAYYELARTLMHMALGNPPTIEQGFANAQTAIDQAVSHDSHQVVYHTYAARIAYFRAYVALQMGKPELHDHFAAASRAYETALKLKPDYPQVMLYLVELHSQFPPNAGADKSKARAYAAQLETRGDIYAAKAKSIVSPESCGVEFWQGVLTNDGERRAEVLEELGKTHLKNEQLDQALNCFNQAVELDPTKTYLFLDLSIYHTFRALQARTTDKELFRQSVKAGDAAITKYLESKPIQPLEAYALGVRSKYKSAAGDQEQARQLVQRAEKLDPYFSKSTGAPDPDLFIRPTEIATRHRYLMRPF